MTLVLGLRCHGGVVLAADSQRTEGGLRDSIPKLFATRAAGILWGTAGTIAITQELFALMRELDAPAGLPRYPTRDAIVRALREAVRRATDSMDSPSPAASSVDGLFAWYSTTTNATTCFERSAPDMRSSQPSTQQLAAQETMRDLPSPPQSTWTTRRCRWNRERWSHWTSRRT